MVHKIKKYTHKTITWIDVENPTLEEIRSLMEEYSIDPNVAKELQLPSYKEKIVLHKKYLYMVMHFTVLRHISTENNDQEIDFIVGQNFIITTRYETIDAIERFIKFFEVNSILEKGIMEDHAGFVLYYIIKEFYKNVSDELDSVSDKLKKIENNIFNGKEKEMVFEISKANRDLINLDHVLRTHKEIINSLEDVASKAFDIDFHNNAIKIANEYYRIENMLSNSIDFVKELRDTNDSLLTTKQNGIMKTLTVVTFLAIPFSVITGFFQMNTLHTPLVGDVNDWKIIVSVEIVSVILLYLLARFKKWL
jgi:magnesium transporter